MVLRRATRCLMVTAGLALAVPLAGAQADTGGPVGHAAGGDAPPLNPAIVGVPMQRTDEALANAADAIDDGDGAAAARALTASRRHLLRSYNGAKYIIAHPPAAPAEEASAKPRHFRKLARRFVRAAHRGTPGRWITAHASGDAAGPVFADGPTAVFNVFTSQYSAATAAVAMAPDTTGKLLAKVKTTLDTAIILRNRLVKLVHAASPPADEEAEGEAATFDTVMPGLPVLIDDELQQLQALSADASAAADAKAIAPDAIAADQQVENLVNQFWPPAAAED